MRRFASSIFLVFGAFVLALAGACGDDESSSSGGPVPGPGTDANIGTGTDGAPNDDAGSDGAAGGAFGPGPYVVVVAGVDRSSIFDVDDNQLGFSADGALIAYAAKDNAYDEQPRIGTNTAKDIGIGPFIRIGRWSGGTTAGRYYDEGTNGQLTFPENAGFHYGVGLPSPSALPSTGRATYAIAEKTAVTVANGSLAPGVITGQVVVDFSGATSKAAVSVTLDLPGSGTYEIKSFGGLASPSIDIATGAESAPSPRFYLLIQAGGAATGVACSGGCFYAVNAAFAGPSFENVIATVAITPRGLDGGSGPEAEVSAVAAFKR